jgi:hypothetical protein
LFLGPANGGNAYPTKKRLARRIALALEERPDLSFSYPGYDTAPDSLLYELLSLAGLLSCPEALFGPLWQVRAALMKRRDLGSLPRTRIALTKALVHNQIHHSELLAIWQAMTAGTG